MKIVSEIVVIGELGPQHYQPLLEIRRAIERSLIVINPTPKGNGVKPIKNGVIKELKGLGWRDEYPMDLSKMRAKPLDAYKSFSDVRVGFEWETGNISSSFRALMKLIKGLKEDKLDLGVHVVPSRNFYKYLTDRVGNISELEPYIDVFGAIELHSCKVLLICVVEYDETDKDAPLIPKGSDGMSLSRRNLG